MGYSGVEAANVSGGTFFDTLKPSVFGFVFQVQIPSQTNKCAGKQTHSETDELTTKQPNRRMQKTTFRLEFLFKNKNKERKDWYRIGQQYFTDFLSELRESF